MRVSSLNEADVLIVLFIRSDEREREEASASRGDTSGDRVTSVPESQDRTTQSKENKTDKADTGGNFKVTGLPRISTLLLYAMFSIAARYAPVAHGTTASPHQVLLEPSSSADAEVDKGREDSVNPGLSAERSTSPGAESSATSKKSEAESELEADSELPEPESGHMWAAGDGFLERAKDLLDKTYANSRPSTVQALLLMGYREIGIGAMAQSWLYIGLAVRMVSTLPPSVAADANVITLRPKIWGCIGTLTIGLAMASRFSALSRSKSASASGIRA